MAEAPKPDENEQPAPPINSPESPAAPVRDQEKETLKQQVAEFKFKEDLSSVSKTYPHASDFSGDIQKLVKEKGYSVEDAALVILNKNNKLQTAEQIHRSTQDRSAGMGGSMDTPPPRDQKDPLPGEKGSVDFYTKRFQELESKGEIRIV